MCPARFHTLSWRHTEQRGMKKRAIHGTHKLHIPARSQGLRFWYWPCLCLQCQPHGSRKQMTSMVLRGSPGGNYPSASSVLVNSITIHLGHPSWTSGHPLSLPRFTIRPQCITHPHSPISEWRLDQTCLSPSLWSLSTLCALIFPGLLQYFLGFWLDSFA